MTVPKSQRGENKLDAFVSARDMATYTANICGNTKIFPGRYRAITNRIVGAAWDCARHAWRANGTYVGNGCLPGSVETRLRLQREAIADCDELLFEMNMVETVFPEAAPKLAEWTGKIVGTKDLLKRWHEADRRRLSPRG